MSGPARCAVTSCDREVAALGYCVAHYRRWQRHGSTRPETPVRRWTPSTQLNREQATRLYRDGASVNGIAQLLGISRTAIYAALREADIPLRTPRSTRRPNTPPQQ